MNPLSVRFRWLIALGLVLGQASFGQSPAQTADDFASKSIEELMDIDVTTVSRKEQKLSKTPAAVYVITQEAIKRSGATTIPDLLRMVPGVQVAQVEANRWAISVRGFNGIYSNKLLVLVDGRSVYTPTFSGVYWDQLDIPLDTIERIEVVRGPGGSSWGANAVNGVINIITKSAQETQGTRVSAGGGSSQTGDYEARFGGKLGSFGAYRAFGDDRSFGNLSLADGTSGRDGWQMRHGGFRADANASDKDTLTFEADGFDEVGGQTLTNVQPFQQIGVPGALESEGFDVMGRWTHRHSDTSESSIQLFDNWYDRNDIMAQKANTIDLGFQNRFRAGSRNDVVWGGEFRFAEDTTNWSAAQASLNSLGTFAQVNPANKNYSLFSAFLQDEIRITDGLSLTVGSKFEHNAFTGFEYEPDARLSWNLSDSTTLWAAVSRPIRQPSRLETAGMVQFPGLSLMQNLTMNQYLDGNPGARSEAIHDYELGFRTMPTKKVSIDLASFYSHYHDLLSAQPGIPTLSLSPAGLVLNVPIEYQNGLTGRGYGAEAAITWNVVPRWKLTASYSFLKTGILAMPPIATSSSPVFSAILPPAILDALFESLREQSENLTQGSPEHQYGIQSYFDVTRKAAFDVSTYYVGHLSETSIPSYTRVDTRFGYKLAKGVEASLVGQNLLSPRHLEFATVDLVTDTQVARSVFGRITWSF